MELAFEQMDEQRTKMNQVFPANLTMSLSICKMLAATHPHFYHPQPPCHREECNLLFMELKVLHQ